MVMVLIVVLALLAAKAWADRTPILATNAPNWSMPVVSGN